jgi:hypothetical protein
MNRYALNNELKGIEIYFDSKPEQSTIDTLKTDGWRWHNFKKCWYTKQSDKSLALAESLVSGSTKEVKAEAKQAPEQTVEGIKIGDIFTYSWGYEQTNVDCFQVVGFKGKSTLLLREIATKHSSSCGNSMAENFIADKDNFVSEEVIQKRLMNKSWGKYITFDHGHGRLWDGREFYVSWYA